MLLTAATCCRTQDEIQTPTQEHEQTTSSEVSPEQHPENSKNPKLIFENFEYWINDNGTVTIANYLGNDETVIVPDTIDGKTVAEIKGYAFWCNEETGKLKHLHIPDSVIYIGDTYRTVTQRIYGSLDSAAQAFAARHAIDFEDPSTGYIKEYSKEPLDPKAVEYQKKDDSTVWFARSPNKKKSIFVEDWNAYYNVPISTDAAICDILFLEDTIYILTTENDTSDLKYMTVYLMNREGKIIQSNRTALDIKIGSEDNFFYNFSKLDCIYVFHMPWREEWAIVTYKSTDLGKTWIRQEGLQAGGSMHEDPRFIDFITNDVGVISYRYHGTDDLCDRTYLTSDGGKTWNPIVPLFYPDGMKGYTEITDLEYINGSYLLTVEEVVHYRNEKEYTHSLLRYSQYVSTDLTEWKFVGYTAEKVPAEYGELLGIFKELLADPDISQEKLDRLMQSGYTELQNLVANMDLQKALFAVKDLNGDGSDELIFLGKDGVLHAVYTLKDQKPSLVGLYFPGNHRGAIGFDGTIYQSGYSKGDTWYFSITKILNNGETEVFSFGEIDYDLYDGVTECYKTVNGEKTVIEKSELDALLEEYREECAYVYVAPTDLITKLNTTLYESHVEDPSVTQKKDANEGLFNTLNIPECYRLVLSNKAKYHDSPGFSYLNQSGELAVVDVDGDGEVEVLIRNSYGITLLRHYNGIVYGYNFSVQSMYRLNTDGTYYWNTNAGNSYGSSRLQFNGKKRIGKELHRVENDGTEYAKFFIDGVEVTEKIFQDYVTKQEQKTEVTWHRMESYPKPEADGK